jgi:hypothetical protein
MKFFTGWVAAAALVLAVPAADAQVPTNGARSPLTTISDFDGPYGPPELPPPPRFGYGSGYSYDQVPGLLPPTEVYAVLRENGFSPLGIPRLRGYVYTIAVIDQRGDDGRLVIDARDGRILRFMPAYGLGPASDEGTAEPYAPQAALPPPAPIPHVATRNVPRPKAAPPRGEAPVAAARPAATEPVAPAQPPQQSAAVQSKPAEVAGPPQASAPTVGQARPAPTILPTQDMPAAQGLE